MKTLNKNWYLDSGCSNHMMCNREWLVNFDDTKKSKVKFADDSTLMVEGIGDVIINRKNGSQAVISSVLFVLHMKCNLLIIGQLVERGYTVIMGNHDKVELFDSNRRLILTNKISKNTTIQVSLDVIENLNSLSTVKVEKSWMWHLRFGYLNFRDLQKLGEKVMVSSMLHICLPINACKSCLASKQSRKPFQSKIKMRSRECLEVVHSDICGPFEVPSLAGNRYFLVFDDEYNRMI